MIRALAALLLFALSAFSQTPDTVTFTATHLTRGAGGGLYPDGSKLCVITTDMQDRPAGYRIGAGGGQTSASSDMDSQDCGTIYGGAMTAPLTVINSAASAQLYACLRVTLFNPTGAEVRRDKCVQTGTNAALQSWCSISGGTETCEWSKYPPRTVANAVQGTGSGSPGAAASVAVGNVTTGAPGSPASVTNSGTSTAAVLNFVLPRGLSGPGLSPPSAFSSSTTYAQWATVTANGNLYLSLVDGNLGHAPSSNGTSGYWAMLAAAGCTGTPQPSSYCDGVSGQWTVIAASNALLKSNNLNDLQSASSARTNLGLGTAATQNSSAFDLAGAAAAACQPSAANCPAASTTQAGLLSPLPSSSPASKVLNGANQFVLPSAAMGLPAPGIAVLVGQNADGTFTQRTGVSPQCSTYDCATYVNNAFTSAVLAGYNYPTANTTSSSTSLTINSTAGYPPTGCGSFSDPGSEALCWTGVSGNTLTGLIRGLFGSTATAHGSGSGTVFFFPWLTAQAACSSCTPAYVVTPFAIVYGGRTPFAPVQFASTVRVNGDMQLDGALAMGGAATLVAGRSTQGSLGIAPIIISSTVTNLSSTQAVTSACRVGITPTLCPAGLYRASVVADSAGASGASGAVTVSLSGSDGTSYTPSLVSLGMSTSPTQASGQKVFYATSAQNIVVSASYSGSGTYNLRIVVEALQ